MESNWRWNVYKTGWQDGGFELCARVVDPINPPHYVMGLPMNGMIGVHFGFPDFSGWVPQWDLFWFVPSYRHFPYGLVVYPD